MHRVAVLTNPPSSKAAATMAAGPPIGPYLRVPVEVHQADPHALRRRYAALKRAIVAGGPVDPMAFTKAKHDWIVATLGQLGLASDHHHRLYDDRPSPPSARLAS
jgi:hypothetical protein